MTATLAPTASGAAAHAARSPIIVQTGMGPVAGELVVAAHWGADLDAALPPAAAFRAVVLTERRPAAEPSSPHVFLLQTARPSRPAGQAVAEPAAQYGGAAFAAAELAAMPTLPAFVRLAREYLAVHQFIVQAVVPVDQPELLLDQTSLLPQLAPAHLLAHPELWPSVRSSFEWFHDQYVALYRVRHRAQVAAHTEAHQRLAAAPEGVEALQRLDAIGALGPPVGAAAVAQWQAVLNASTPCRAAGRAEGFAAGARCAACGFRMDAPSPDRAATAALRTLTAALATQVQRLSSATVRRILEDGHRPALERFLQVLRASDADALVRVLDDRVAGFLHELLTPGEADPPVARVFPTLRERYGVIEESDIPSVVKEFRRLLRAAAGELRRQHPGGPVRFRLE